MIGGPRTVASTRSPQAGREHCHVASGDVRGRLVPGAPQRAATVHGQQQLPETLVSAVT